MPNQLSAADLKKIVTLVVKAMPTPTPVAQPQPSSPVMQTHIPDDNSGDVAIALDETEAQLIHEMTNPRILTTRGKNRTVTTNLTQQALDNIQQIRRERSCKNSVQYT